MDVEKDADGSAVPRAYYGTGEKRKRFPVNVVTGESQVLHIKTFNPSDPFRGLPPFKAAARTVDSGPSNLELAAISLRRLSARLGTSLRRYARKLNRPELVLRP